MKRFAALAALPLLLLACSKAPEPAATAPKAAPVHKTMIDWVKPVDANIDAIFAQAKAANKPVFLYWGAIWCPPCNQIKATVFNRQDFIDRSSFFVPVYLDGDTQGAQKLAAQFKVRGYPTMILFKPDGTELTRLPGEVDSSQYMEVLSLGLGANSTVKESLAMALGQGPAGAATKMSADAWRMLAYYSWDTDEAQLLPKAELAVTLDKLARNCPSEYAQPAARLALKAIAAGAQLKAGIADKTTALARVHQTLSDPALARQNADLLVYYGGDIVPAITAAASPERAQLLASWNKALDTLNADVSLSRADRLSAVQGKVALAKLDQGKGQKPPLSAELIAQARQAASVADKSTTNTYERQAVIPSAADLLTEVGLLDESDTLLKAELPKAISPYYHMLGLAQNAKQRGDKAGSLKWAEQAYADSTGPATRLQWGTGYVGKVIDLTPEDSERIEKAAASVIAELEAVPETFYERNRRGLEKMGKRLIAWNQQGKHATTLKKLTLQLDGVCGKLAADAQAQQACSGIFKPSTDAPKA
ncbi:thioredoxin family protein [Rhodoferax sp.]|uniref:thioredoxin family protein n=1 Tax=Rhodoferax sp. TaxID=50421 RepID=UPI002747208C|nr:thioredoxin fold domain-containing protein [Rhodoferax sp.]